MTIEIDASAQKESNGYIVKGQIRLADKSPLVDAIVRAFDKDLRSEQLLSETITKKDGQYEIGYSRGKFRRAEKKSADLIVRVFDPEAKDLLLGESELVFKAKSVEVINLTVTKDFSEYERYMATIGPVRENVPVAELTEDDITFLNKETGIDTELIGFLVTAARLAKKTKLPSEVFYGLVRQGLPSNLSDLLEQNSVVLRKALKTALKKNIIPSRLKDDLDKFLESLSQLKEVDPGIQRKQQKEKIRRLGRVVDLADAKLEAVLKKTGSPTLLNDRALTSLVKDDELEEDEAKELGLTVSLYALFDDKIELAEAVKKGDFPQLLQGKVTNIEDLVIFEKADWLAVLKQTKTQPPDGLNREAYAALLAKKVENLYPSKVMLARVTSRATDGMAQGLEEIKPLLEKNEVVFGTILFDELDVEGLDAKEVEKLRASHTRLKALANTYPGMDIDAMLDDRQLSTNDKEEQIRDRIVLLTRFHTQNPDKEFLSLDYSPESADIQALNFTGFGEDEQRMTLKTVKAYQRMYSVTRDAAHAKLLLEQGHHSPLSIARMSRKQFADTVGLDKPVGDHYYGNACALMIKTGVGTIGMIDGHHAAIPWAAVGNSDYQSPSDYLKKIDGWEALFGSLDYCKCQHCQSILSPAAYFVDLMRFLEKTFYFEGSSGSGSVAWETAAGFRAREDHPLHLRKRRPHLWKLPLTCENTNQLIPYLDIINEVLENYIALGLVFDEESLPETSADRSSVENLVYEALQNSIHSFRQPFSLPLEKLDIYLSHFDVTRGEIASLMEAPEDDTTAATLNLSKLGVEVPSILVKREYELITRANMDIEPLKDLYGIEFNESGHEITFSDPDVDGLENDAQLLLKSMGLTRTELGELITTKFVITGGVEFISTGEFIEIRGEKRDEEKSVQNDIERIHGLSRIALDRMHRFTRLWQYVPWTIKELDLVLSHLVKAELTNGIEGATLRYIVDILSVQKRFSISVEEFCALWSNLPEASVVKDKESLFDRLFNLPDFVRIDGRFPQNSTRFLDPVFRLTPPDPDEVDYALHRLLAGLKVDDETLHLIIINLSEQPGLSLDSADLEDKKFPLTLKNLSLLYRHVRLAECLKLSIPQQFQLIHLSDAITEDHISSLDDLTAFLEFYDWWQTTNYSLDDLEFITGAEVEKPAGYADAGAITQRILQKVKADQALTFKDTVFGHIEGVTEEQSQKIIQSNITAIVKTVGNRYRVSEGFGQATPIVIPEGIPVSEEEIRELLSTHRTIPDFDDTLFTEITGVNDSQSQAIVEANLTAPIDKVKGARYRVSDSLTDTSPINIPTGMPEDISAIAGEEVTAEELIEELIAEVRKLLNIYHKASQPVFDDDLFNEITIRDIYHLTDEQSKAIVKANPELIVLVPVENTYWLTETFRLTDALTIPVGVDGVPVTESNARTLIQTYHASEVIPNYIAAELGISVEKTKGLIGLTEMDLAESRFTNALLEGDQDGVVLSLVETLLPLNVLFKNDTFDSNALNFISNHHDLFGEFDFDNISIETIRMLSIYHSFLSRTDEDDDGHEQLQELLLAFDSGTSKFYTGTTNHETLKEIQTALAKTLDAEIGLVITAHEEIELPDAVINALDKLHNCIELSKQLGVGCEVFKIIISNDYENLNRAANAIMTAFRTKYEDEEELRQKIEPFEDKIRTRKVDALSDYLIHSLETKIFSSLNDLYHYFLIDVELEGCARTSRVVAANSSVQLYVHRILMNLEQDRAGEIKLSFNDEDAIQEWEWRKNYRVWEANRKIFLYPENYIEPDLRDNKTALFEELESTLLQQEINEDTVLDAYASYMRGFDEVANLKIAGSYHDIGEKTDFLHLFGVTASDPRTYYYRVVENAYWGEKEPDEYGIVWHPWHKIDVQIPVKKVSTIVFNGRLYVFWVEINTNPRNVIQGGSSRFVGYQHKMTLKFTILRLDGTWAPPQNIFLDSGFPYEHGDGIIHDSLILKLPVPMVPQYDMNEIIMRSHLEAIPGYTLRGFAWEQIYPCVYDDSLVVTGRLFQMRSFVDFYLLEIGQQKSEIDSGVMSSIPGEWQTFPARRLLCLQDPNILYYGLILSDIWIDSYAHASIVVDKRRLDDFKWLIYYGTQNGLGSIEEPESFVDKLREGLYNNAVAYFSCDTQISPVNGSICDGIADCDGDLLYFQDDPAGGIPYHIKRIGTTLSTKICKKLFESSVNGFLSIEAQQELRESPMPLVWLNPECVADRSNVHKIGFTGPYGVYYREIFFHIPFLIANHLNSQQKFAEAQKWYHYIFDPTAKASDSDTKPEDRNWRYLEFRKNDVESLREQLTDTDSIETYKKDPFNPHAISRLPLRFSAYQKSIVMKYIDNLLDWGDHLFAQDTMESINEATLLYVLASDILGESPVELGECGEVGPKTYKEIVKEIAIVPDKENEFLIEMFHNVQKKNGKPTKVSYDYAMDPSLLYSATKNARDYITTHEFTTSDLSVAAIDRESELESATTGSSTELVGTFHEKGHSKVQGTFHSLGWRYIHEKESNTKNVIGFLVDIANQIGPLFCIPQNKELQDYWDRVEDRLFKIRNCMNISGVRRELSLFAPEIDPMLLVRAKAAGLSIEDVLNSISGNLPPYRFSYLIERAKGYATMLQGFGSALLSALEKKDIEDLNLMRTVNQQNILKMTSQVREDEYAGALEHIQALKKRQEIVYCRRNYYKAIFDDKLIDQETVQEDKMTKVKDLYWSVHLLEGITAALYLLPQFGAPTAMVYGGKQVGNSAECFVRVLRNFIAKNSSEAALAGLQASFERRKQGWQHQIDMADKEFAEIEKQIEIAQIRADIAEKLREIHYKTVEQQQEVYEFYRDKFTKLGLYTWLSTNLQRLFRDAYNNAYAMAKLAEHAYRFERGDDSSELIGPNHWEASKAGLLAGERLLIDLQNLERKFLETNYRSLEIDQAFSLTQINPAALIQLKETGACQFEILEIFFDLFYPGHYRRRIKAVRLTIPCITGPYTNVSASLTLTDSQIRNEPKLGQEYLLDVPRSRSITIATSTAQNDAGVFELNFRDERYMPFEGAGAISSWQLSLPKNFRQFDYQTINDMILHISYTAEEDGALRQGVEGLNDTIEGEIIKFLQNYTLQRVFSFRQEFSSEFNRLLHSPPNTEVQIQISDKHFPIFIKCESLNIIKAVLVLRTPEGQSVTGLSVSIINGTTLIENGTTLTEFSEGTQFGGLPTSNNFNDLFSDGILGEHKLIIEDAGDLIPDSPAPSDVSAIDSEKLTDIYLYLEYGIS